MNPLPSNNDNEFWDGASIKLDIAIDEQDDKKCNDIVTIEEKSVIAIKKAKTPKLFSKALRIGKELLPVKINGEEPTNHFWRIYFLAKRIRGILQNENSDRQSRKIDWVVDLLIKEATSQISEDNKFQYLLLMLELTACTVGEQSLGFSEKAKEILNSHDKPFPKSNWKYSIYMALIHYNQGLAMHHMAKYRDALREFDNALREFDRAKDIDKITDWRRYVYCPALLQKAEVLIKMQFSYNALLVLEEIKDSYSSVLQRRRREFLKLTCYYEISDWKGFDSHWEKIIECKNKTSVFRDKDGQPIFQIVIPRGEKDKLDFLNAATPLSSDPQIPFSLISIYNSLVLDRAKQIMKDKISLILKGDTSIQNISDFKISTFIESYGAQCKDNRFDKLTLEETVLDYIKIVGKLIDKKDDGKKETFKPLMKDPCRIVLKGLLQILEDNSFIDDIDSTEKPSIKLDTVREAKNILEEINDSFLKKCFPGKDIETPGKLRDDVIEFFKFEIKFLEKLQNLKNRPGLLNREYDKKSLKIRQRLLTKIDAGEYELEKIKDLQKHFVCIFKDTERKKEYEHCITEVIKAIEKDQGTDDPGPFTLQFSDYDNILNLESRRFQKHTTGRSLQPLPVKKEGSKQSFSVNYVGLRRWTSYTPELSFSVGGGHFVFLSEGKENNKGKVGIGIAVDPGFDFIRNFFRQGFTLTDIDIIILTHGHPDHIRDFPAIVELLHENKKRGNGQEKKIYAVMSLGCYERLDDYIAKDPFKLLFYDTIIVDIYNRNLNERGALFTYEKKGDRVTLLPPNKTFPISKNNIDIRIKYFASFHDDHSESDSYGYIIKFKDGKNKVSTGFTGDSKWFPEYSKKFKECDVICSHIGSIVESKPDKLLKNYTNLGKAERLMRTKNHPYLFGEILFWQNWKHIFSNTDKKTLMLISEFGEEMKGKIRCDLAQRFNRPRKEKCCWLDYDNDTKCTYSQSCEEGAKNMIVVPVDVGLRISIPLGEKIDMGSTNNDLHPHHIHCAVCENFVVSNEIDYEVYSHEEAIFYICNTCLRSTSPDVRYSIYQKYHEKGRDIEKYE